MSEREQRPLDTLQQNRRRPPKFTASRIDMSHGAGGKATHKLIEGLLLPAFDNPALAPLADAATLPLGDSRIALTTDSYVVRPLVFPGGSIGELAVNGTVNDLAVSGATPLALSAALIIEEGLETEVLAREIEAMAKAAEKTGVSIATGDTKVVERGKGDGLYVITTGVGIADQEIDPLLILCLSWGQDPVLGHVRRSRRCHPDRARRPGTGSRSPLRYQSVDAARCGPQGIGRKELAFHARPHARRRRDCAQRARSRLGLRCRSLGGEAPIRDVVHGACEILGIDPLYVANEGKLLAVVAPEAADAALGALRDTEGGEDAQIIGEIREEPERMVIMHTRFGGTRMIDMLVGDPLPRIC